MRSSRSHWFVFLANRRQLRSLRTDFEMRFLTVGLGNRERLTDIHVSLLSRKTHVVRRARESAHFSGQDL
jgi:hypothetical protein